jgi:hypothetical protein
MRITVIGFLAIALALIVAVLLVAGLSTKKPQEPSADHV